MNIVFQNISKQYNGKYALNNFNSELKSGVYGLLGANGAGKTTLINIFVGILKKDSGNILIDGVNANDMGKNFLAHIGYLPQYPEFYKDFTVWDFLKYMSVLKDIPARICEERIDELLSIVNLIDAKNKKIGALSGGMRQRVGIVQAMLGNPDILILDEPTAGLDPRERIRFRNLITRFSKNRIVLLATHIVSDIEFIANEVIILKEGNLIKQNSPAVLQEEIVGKVWSVTLPDTIDLSKYDKFRISNMQRTEGKITLRVISDEKPDSTAVAIKANLEDVFLYYFGDGVDND